MLNTTLVRNFARLSKNRIDGKWVKSAGPICYDIKDPVSIFQVPNFFKDYPRSCESGTPVHRAGVQ